MSNGYYLISKEKYMFLTEYAEVRNKIKNVNYLINYMDLLESEPKIQMFVPSNEDGVVLTQPNSEDYETNGEVNYHAFKTDFEEYRKALEVVLFEGFTVENIGHTGKPSLLYGTNIIAHVNDLDKWVFKPYLKVKDFIKFNLVITNDGIKHLGRVIDINSSENDIQELSKKLNLDVLDSRKIIEDISNTNDNKGWYIRNGDKVIKAVKHSSSNSVGEFLTNHYNSVEPEFLGSIYNNHLHGFKTLSIPSNITSDSDVGNYILESDDLLDKLVELMVFRGSTVYEVVSYKNMFLMNDFTIFELED